MICYKRLFCNNRYLPSFLISLAVFSYTQLSNAEVYDVNITNNGVDVNVTSLPSNAYDFSNSFYDANQFDSSDIQFGDDSPMGTYSASGDGGTPYGGAESDFQNTSYFTPNTNSYDPLKPTLTGTNPLLFQYAKYFSFKNFTFRSNSVTNYNTTPLNMDSANNEYGVSIQDSFVSPGALTRTRFFQYTQFKNDILSALLGSENLSFYIRLFELINSPSTSTNFTYTVPSIFGFDTGFVIDIPLHDILHGSGDWTNIGTIVNLFRSMMSLVYYLTVVYVVWRCLFIHI